jgi:hypothetical protein
VLRLTQVKVVTTAERNVKLIDEFVSGLGVLSLRRVKKYRLTLGKISRELGPLENVTAPDLRAYIEKINLSDYEDWTKRVLQSLR